MIDRERFSAVMSYGQFDRVPVYYFGQWEETLARWLGEGFSAGLPLAGQLGLDSDWENGMWDAHGLAARIHAGEPVVLEETDTYRIVRDPDGAILKQSKVGECISQHIRHALEPTRESWQQFKKTLNPDLSPVKVTDEMIKAKAAQLNARDGLVAILGGSLFGGPRGWLGLENISLLSYDDPALYEEIIEAQLEMFMRINEPILRHMRVDVAYIFEDCCGRSGPMFSPETFRRYYHKPYMRLVEFYKSRGVKWVMLDSDGYVEPLIPCWLGAGIDILFPIEVGVWRADPIALRRKYGKDLRMVGGFDKHLIAQGDAAVRAELERLRPLVAQGGFIPMPDHRIPPNCSLAQFKAYTSTFRNVLSGTGEGA